MRFDLLKLHDNYKDKDMKGSWIKANGKTLNPLITKILEEMLLAKNQNNLAKEVMKNFNCSFSTSKRCIIRLKRKVPWIELKLIDFLLNYWARTTFVSKSVLESKKQEILGSIEFLKVGQRQSKPVKAPKRLTVNLCKIAGAHAADGSLSPNYGIRLMEGSKTSVTKWADWFYSEFGVKLAVVKAKEQAFKTEKYNKVIARYLNVFFGFPFGKKSSTVEEPQIIKKAGLKYRRAFALGALTFDGSVSLAGLVSFSSKSEQLAQALENILKRDKIKCNIRKTEKGFVLNANNSKRNFNPKLLDYFEKETPKWNRLAFVGKKAKQTKPTDDYYNNIFYSPNMPLSNLTLICERLDVFDYQALLGEIKNNYKTSGRALLPYKDFLIKAKIVKIVKKLSPNKLKKANIKSKSGIYVKINEKSLKILQELLVKKFGSIKRFSKESAISKTNVWHWLSGKYSMRYVSFEKINKIVGFEENNLRFNFLTNHKEIYSFNKDFKSTSTTLPAGTFSLKSCE